MLDSEPKRHTELGKTIYECMYYAVCDLLADVQRITSIARPLS
jgi:hypothetical protein